MDTQFKRPQHILIWVAVIIMILIADGGIGVFMGWNLTLKDAPRNNSVLAKPSTYTSTLSLAQCPECMTIQSARENIMYRKGSGIVSEGQKTIKSVGRNRMDIESSSDSPTLRGAVSPQFDQ